MPSQLAKLYRFFRHETDDLGVIWNVASAPYEAGSRLYRIMYKDQMNSELSFDVEQIILVNNNKWRKGIEPIVQCILRVFEKELFLAEFREACRCILQEDPWLEEYFRDACELLTKTHPSPCT